MRVDEAAFEAEIVASLVEHGGYAQAGAHEFDAEAGLDFGLTLAFVGVTQQEQWERLITLHGGQDNAQQAFKRRLVKELDSRGTGSSIMG